MTLLGRVRKEIELWTLALRLRPRGRGVVVAAADAAVRPTAAGLWLRGCRVRRRIVILGAIAVRTVAAVDAAVRPKDTSLWLREPGR